MSQLFESIRIQNGRRYLLDYHSQRMNKSIKALFGIDDPFDLKKLIEVPYNSKTGTYKCKVVYDKEIRSISFSTYYPKQVQSLKIVHDDNMEYDQKYVDRNNIDRLFKLRSGCDDVLIVRKGLVSDTSICNIVFLQDGNWVTPKSCLLKGIQRQNLLDKGRIRETNITLQQLSSFSHFKLINAMKPFTSANILSIENIQP